MSSRSRTHRIRLDRRMARASGQRHRRILEFRVGRVLEILADESLISAAALNLGSADGLIFECGFADVVWDDYRVQARLRELDGDDIIVELRHKAIEVAGETFSRPQILVLYGAGARRLKGARDEG